jgi:hypothetical protein
MTSKNIPKQITHSPFKIVMSKHKWGVGKVQGAGAGWTGGKVRSPECRVPCTFPNRAALWGVSSIEALTMDRRKK